MPERNQEPFGAVDNTDFLYFLLHGKPLLLLTPQTFPDGQQYPQTLARAPGDIPDALTGFAITIRPDGGE